VVGAEPVAFSDGEQGRAGHSPVPESTAVSGDSGDGRAETVRQFEQTGQFGRQVWR